ncbi:MAG TPA: phosphatase PAP2 family protein [Streptosporangiaceae bacterium]|nr:phosphatase PAP2 family protein [Streptosporangiaceae bacterium]
MAELATIAAGYAAYSLVRLAIHADHQVAFSHAAQLWQAERGLHVTPEPFLNHLTAGHLMLAEAAGYYYGLLHFLVTPLVLAWLYLRRPAAFPRLRSALVLATAAATVVFWAWPVAPPRFSVPGMTDIMVAHNILSAAHPRVAASLVNLYAAMPSLHVAWAAWCALAVATATRGRLRHLAWLYPAATTLVVLASANHFLLDAAGGIAAAGLGMLAASTPAHLPARLARPHRHPRAAYTRHWQDLAAGHPPADASQPTVSGTPGPRSTTQPGTTAGISMAADTRRAATTRLYTVTVCSHSQRGIAADADDISAGCIAVGK